MSQYLVHLENHSNTSFNSFEKGGRAQSTFGRFNESSLSHSQKLFSDAFRQEVMAVVPDSSQAKPLDVSADYYFDNLERDNFYNRVFAASQKSDHQF